ncbi:ZIP family metal transporter [Fuerstiella marisgermanici]|uniref:ZIP Zinc transporter n=1 Tax=Fuerstiella marisgermanici TaxID=1891926 RepID=A0A1P8WAA8_9PLAN|nr:divalent cation transporter [Fuerstiella marisgermanici]APZ90964.1 ZIP Zinc transporter [Fuerstiella marisgermanici]
MSPVVELLLLTAIAGAAMPIGGFVASFEHIRSNWLRTEFRHSVIAFGGGALFSAIALVLIPEGIKHLEVWESVTAFAAGGVGFWLLQILLDRSKSSSTQMVAMLSDFIPEVIALGATFATGGPGVVVLASIITLQNLPEGFNSYRELRESGLPTRRILTWFSIAALLGPLMGAFGYWMLADQQRLLGWMQLFAASGIMYLVFDDIAPQAKLKNSSLPALGSVLGFLLGLLGKLLDG